MRENKLSSFNNHVCIASFDAEFKPLKYLNTYYQHKIFRKAKSLIISLLQYLLCRREEVEPEEEQNKTE